MCKFHKLLGPFDVNVAIGSKYSAYNSVYMEYFAFLDFLFDFFKLVFGIKKITASWSYQHVYRGTDTLAT